MKVLLIYPHFLEARIHLEEITSPPIGLYSVAAALKEIGHEAEILNWHDRPRTLEEIRETLDRTRPHVIGFSVVHANRWGAIDIAETAKRIDPNLRIVFGGPGATFLWRHLLTYFPAVDYVVVGEGEHTFPKLLTAFERGNESSLEGLDGIAYRDGQSIVEAKRPKIDADLDDLPIPAKYFEYNHVSSSRGCNWKCRFCGSPGLWHGRTRFRSPRHFVEELELLYRKGITFFYVSDDTFTQNRTRVIEICREILKRNLRIDWYAISRVDCVDEEILYWMRTAGCIQISYGVESGSEKIRAVLNKKIAADQVKRAFALTRSYGILPRAYFIYGSPGETRETIEESVALIREIKPLAAIFYILDLFPGTEFYERLKRSGRVTDDIWLNRIEGLMYLDTDPDLSAELVLSYGRSLRSAFYENVHSFAESISLVDRKELYGKHADFCSRLAMTFSQGDYSRNEMVKDKERVAERLFRKALEYAPDERAYLGLGMLKQRSAEKEDSVRILREGIEHFPKSESLHLCLGISYMNLHDHRGALEEFSLFPNSDVAKRHMKLLTSPET